MMTENTGNELNKYKDLCRICLGYSPNGIDITDDDNNSQLNRSQRDAILNNYAIITKLSVRKFVRREFIFDKLNDIHSSQSS